jgi:CTP synthase
VDTIYQVPLNFHEEGLDEVIREKLGMWTARPNFSAWQNLVQKVQSPVHTVKIGVVGKYVDLKESYKSLSEALIHAGVANESKVELVYVDSEELQKGKSNELLQAVDGILIPGGFGERGVEGKILAIEYARTRKKPFFGICLGLQLSVIEFARNVCGIQEATSLEFSSNSKFDVITVMESQKNVTQKGGTMRLGAYDCQITRGTKAFQAYQKDKISERHRHRFEVNNKFRSDLEKNGLVISGVHALANPPGVACEQTELVEMIELKDHPWFVGCQFHPEFKSKPLQAHPLFAAFIKASLENQFYKK